MQQPAFQIFVAFLRLLWPETRTNDGMRAVLYSPNHMARTLAMKRRAIRDGRDLLADLQRVLVVALELDPLRFGGQPQEFIELGLEVVGRHARSSFP